MGFQLEWKGKLYICIIKVIFKQSSSLTIPMWSTISINVVCSIVIVAMPPCEGILDTPLGRLTSFGYPNGYPNGLHCKWIIKRSEQDQIYIYFSDFELAYRDFNDFLKVCNFYFCLQ